MNKLNLYKALATAGTGLVLVGGALGATLTAGSWPERRTLGQPPIETDAPIAATRASDSWDNHTA